MSHVGIMDEKVNHPSTSSQLISRNCDDIPTSISARIPTHSDCGDKPNTQHAIQIWNWSSINRDALLLVFSLAFFLCFFSSDSAMKRYTSSRALISSCAPTFYFFLHSRILVLLLFLSCFCLFLSLRQPAATFLLHTHFFLSLIFHVY